jgi:ABC-type lipoprotein export system ATPase subunit
MNGLTLRAVTHRYESPGPPALYGVDLTVGPGQTVALTGGSGSGKSTLLAIAGLLVRPTSGQVLVDDVDASRLGESARTVLRRSHIGFLFQEARLLRHLTVLENVLLPVLATATRADPELARDLLDRVGLAHLADRRPGTLSGGQAQRAAFCRALVTRPNLVLADEPTSALDADLTAVLCDLLGEAAAEGVGVVVATHDPLLMAWAGRVVQLRGGAVEASRQRPVSTRPGPGPTDGAGR